MASASDDFNRANENLDASANWNDASEFDWSHPTITSNQVQFPNSTNPSTGGWIGDSFGDDHFAQATLTYASIAGDEWVGPAVRVTNTASIAQAYLGGYNAAVDPWDARARIMEFNDSYDVGLLTSSSTILSVGDVLRIEADGTALEFFIDGVSELTTADASFASGYPGVAGADNTTLDDWSGGDLVAAGGSLPPIRRPNTLLRM